ncbi:MAG: alpha/beta hydrolase fold domain-containing protein, partial [Nocardioidaceae bacterium]
WVSEHAVSLGADPERVAVGGDSAGGTLSAAIAVKAAEAGVPLRFQLLVYPATDLVGATESRRLFGEGYFLTREFVELSLISYVTGGQDVRDPLVSVSYTEKVPANLAPALVVTAGFDPLRDEGEAYARMLADAGVRVELTRYPGLAHGFFNVVGLGPSMRAAVAEIAARLQSELH